MLCSSALKKTNRSWENDRGFNRVLTSAVSLNVSVMIMVMMVVHVFH